MMKTMSALPAKNSETDCNSDYNNKRNNTLEEENCVKMKRKNQISTECACQMATDPEVLSVNQCDFYHQNCHNLDFNSSFSEDNFVSTCSDGNGDNNVNCSNLETDDLIKYETYLENIDPENLCDCENCLTTFKKNPERVLACYGIEVGDEQTAADHNFENNQYSDQVENCYRFADNDINNDNEEEEPILVNESSNVFVTDNLNSTFDTGDNMNSNNNHNIKSRLIKNVILDLPPKPYEPLPVSVFSQSMPFIAQRKQEKPLEGLKIVTISLNCKVESCPLIFLDKPQLDFHMLYAHDMHPFKCWAGCVEKYFPCRKSVGAHNKTYHPDNNLWRCNMCPNKAYAKYNTLYSHLRLEHESGTFTCTWPNHNATFRTRHEVITHINFEHAQVDDNGMKIKKKKYYYSKSTKTQHNDASFSENQGDNEVKNEHDFSETEQLRVLKPKKESMRPPSPEVEEAFSWNDLPLPIRERKLLSSKLKEDSAGTYEKYQHQFICRWPSCGQTSRLLRNLKTHIRTVHFKFLKADTFNVAEVDEKVSQYIYNTLS